MMWLKPTYPETSPWAPVPVITRWEVGRVRVAIASGKGGTGRKPL